MDHDTRVLSCARPRGRRRQSILDQILVDEGSEGYLVQPSVILLDAKTLEPVETLPLAAHGLPESGGAGMYWEHSLIGSTGSPILYAYAGEDAGLVWRVETAPLRLESIDLPALPDRTVPSGFENGGRVLLRGASGPVLFLDLDTGTVVELAVGETLHFDASYAEGLYADATGATAVFPATGGLALVGIDWEGAWTSVESVPVAGNRVRSLFHTANGSVLVTPVVSGVADQDGSSLALSLLVDASGVWRFVGDDCGGLEGEGWVVVGDRAVRLQATGGDDGVFELLAVVAEVDQP